MTKSIDNTRNTFLGTEYRDGYPDIKSYYNTVIDKRVMNFGDSGHYGYPDFPNDRSVGGPFKLNGVYTFRGLTGSRELWRGGALNQRYVGSLSGTIDPMPAFGTNPVFTGTSSPDAWGATAYSKMKPTKPSFEALNAAYELREVPEMLRQRFLDSGLAGIGKYHLALQFGWKPLLNDVKNLVLSQQKMQDRINQLIRDDGKPVRRRVTLLDQCDIYNDVSGTGYGEFQPVLSTQYYRSIPKYRHVTTIRDQVWASARFRYWLPDGPRDINFRRRMMAELFGLHPRPSVIYNAIPWSWLNDWFSNTGDILTNLDAGVANRLAADYFYVMRRRELHAERTAWGYFWDRNNNPVDMTVTSYSTSFTKERVVGDPFGFATNPNGLSGMQLSILGALGLSRLR